MFVLFRNTNSKKKQEFRKERNCHCLIQEVDDSPRGVIPLVDVGVREVEDDRTKQFCFELFPLTGDKVKASKPAPGEVGKWIDGKIQKPTKISNVFSCLVSVGHHTVYRMSATSEDDRKDWIRALRIASQNQLPKQRLS